MTQVQVLLYRISIYKSQGIWKSVPVKAVWQSLLRVLFCVYAGYNPEGRAGDGMKGVYGIIESRCRTTGTSLELPQCHVCLIPI